MASEINRSNFDSHWLEYISISEHDEGFKKLKLKEKDDSRDSIKRALSDAIIDHHMIADEIEYYVEELGYSSLAKRLPPKYITTKKGKIKLNTVRIGSFGEVVAAEHLCQCYSCLMPIYKLRYGINKKIALPGEDIIVFKMDPDGKIKTICLGEVKTSKAFASDNVTKAHEQLNKSYVEPVAFEFISQRLFENNEADLAKQIIQIVGKLGLKNFPTENWIFIITGNDPGAPFKPVSELPLIVDDLHVVSLYLSDLHDFIDEIFKLVGKSP